MIAASALYPTGKLQLEFDIVLGGSAWSFAFSLFSL
jgi:hypothetical protein